jgi:small-conductance mechanosensitive channel
VISQFLVIGLGLVAILLAVLALPISDTARDRVLQLLGLVLTGILALSSTTFVANIMAGIMLRLVHSFYVGDFIRIGDAFGCVVERGLLHTEVQTEDRDLTTFPNLHLITNPVTVIRSSGSIISAKLSLGYDVPHEQAEKIFLEAATTAGLHDPFVHVLDIGNDAITYKVAGFLTEVQQILSARSHLKKQILSALHTNGIEIVSPHFINQRVLPTQARIIPQQIITEASGLAAETAPERLMFDKAEDAKEKERELASEAVDDTVPDNATLSPKG